MDPRPKPVPPTEVVGGEIDADKPAERPAQPGGMIGEGGASGGGAASDEAGRQGGMIGQG